MKLEFPEINVTTSKAFESAKFGIGDERVIMDILRNKMYADPISSVCREVMSNSRDANREAGRADTPIVVKMPNSFEDNISFCDNGLGITPSRMENIFIKYGNSTKRSDNIQTGGFGLGAKTPFAISDTFTIVTVTEENGKRHKRTYIAYIDNSRYGAMSLVSEEETDEDTGTSITVAVKKTDRRAFEAAVMYVGSHWKIKPSIQGFSGQWHWTTENVIFENKVDKWSLIGHGPALIIIDGIAYKIRTNTLFAGKEDIADAKRVMNSPVRLYFDVGELTVTATREDLDYCDETIDKILAVANKMVDYLRKKVQAAVAKCDNLWDASIEWRNVGHNFRQFMIKPLWKGMTLLDGRNISTGWNNATNKSLDVYAKITLYEFDVTNDKVITMKNYRRGLKRDIPVASNYILVENDDPVGQPNKLRLRKMFELGAEYIGLVQFRDYASDGGAEGRKLFEKVYNWSHLGAVKLSSIPKAKNPNKVRGKIVVHKVKKLIGRSGRGGTVYEWKPEDTRTAEDSNGGLYVIIASGKITLSDGNVISKSGLSTLQKELGQPIFGMLYKWRKKINPAWTDVLTYVKAEIKKLEAHSGVEDYLKYGWDSRAQAILGEKDFALIRKHTWKKSNLFAEWLDISGKVELGYSNHNKLLKLRRAIHLRNPGALQPANAIMRKLAAKVKEKYPLVFGSVRNYNSVGDKLINEWIFYIEAKSV